MTHSCFDHAASKRQVVDRPDDLSCVNLAYGYLIAHSLLQAINEEQQEIFAEAIEYIEVPGKGGQHGPRETLCFAQQYETIYQDDAVLQAIPREYIILPCNQIQELLGFFEASPQDPAIYLLRHHHFLGSSNVFEDV